MQNKTLGIAIRKNDVRWFKNEKIIDEKIDYFKSFIDFTVVKICLSGLDFNLKVYIDGIFLT